LHDSCAAIVSRLAGYDHAVEVGIGRRPEVAAGLAEHGVDVVVTDVHERETPSGVAFAREDVTEPDPARYGAADVVYALRCPPELQRPLRDAARLGDADCFFTTLGTDPAVVRSDPETLGGTTLFRVRTDVPGSGTSTGSGPGDATREPASGGDPA
jgi:uncharacterized UPF0146 family protein